nr:retrovirus-related Pol polyprotein from transposon TNT 1-94 [Tanacetum cinerariifolium]
MKCSVIIWYSSEVYIIYSWTDIKDCPKDFSIDSTLLVYKEKFIGISPLNLLDGVPELLHKDFRDVCRDCKSLEACGILDNINADLKCFFILRDNGLQSDIDTPMVEKNKLYEDLHGKQVDATLYRCMIGSLLYLTSNWPDLIYAVCLCARYQAKPTKIKRSTTFILKLFGLSGLMGGSRPLSYLRLTSKDGKFASCGPKVINPSGFLYTLLLLLGLKPKVLSLIRGELREIVRTCLIESDFGSGNEYMLLREILRDVAGTSGYRCRVLQSFPVERIEQENE